MKLKLVAMNRRLLIFLLPFFTITSFAQDYEIAWQNTIGGSVEDRLWGIRLTSDGGSVAIGFSKSGVSGDKTEANLGDWDYWVVKLDNSGEITWQNTIGGSGFDVSYDIVETLDGGYIIAGTSSSGISGDKTEASRGGIDYWLVKLDSSGNVIWDRTYGGSENDILADVVLASDGGYVLAGRSNSNISGDKTENTNGFDDYWVIKVDSSGDIEWQNTIGGNGGDVLNGLCAASDGHYILSGHSNSNASGDKSDDPVPGASLFDYWIVKIDGSGSVVWDKTIGGGGSDVFATVVELSDSNLGIVGSSGSDISGSKTENNIGDGDYWALKLNSAGDIIWDNTVGGTANDSAWYIKAGQNGNMFIGGFSFSGVSGDKDEANLGANDFWIVELDSSGDLVSQESIGGSGPDELRAFDITADESILLGGFSESPADGDKTEPGLGSQDYWVVFLDNLLSTPDIDEDMFRIYPNPVVDILEIDLNLPITKYAIISSSGTLIKESNVVEESKFSLDLSGLSSGVYYISLSTANGKVTKKIIKL